MPPTHPAPLFREAMDLVRPSAADIAAALSLPTATLNSYHAGVRPTPPTVRGALAQYLRTHAAMLETMAAELEADLPAPAPA